MELKIRKTKRTKITEEQLKKAIEDYQSGKSIAEISREIKICFSGVQRQLKKYVKLRKGFHGIEPSINGNYFCSDLTEEQWLFYVQLLDDNSQVQPNGCITWTGCLSCKHAPYGRMRFRTKNVASHRLSYCLYHNKDLKPDIFVCHACDNSKCINPLHLWEGATQDNTADRCSKNRTSRPIGFKNGTSKLREPDIYNIKKLYYENKKTITEISRIYNVSGPTISGVILQYNWTHVVFIYNGEEK